jgi:outer membrane protein TolC
MIDFLNLLDSQRTLLEFRLAHLRALVDCGQRLAELERIVGKSLSNDKTSGEDK